MSDPLEELKRLRGEMRHNMEFEDAEAFPYWYTALDAIILALEERDRARAKVVAEMRAADNSPELEDWADRLERGK